MFSILRFEDIFKSQEVRKTSAVGSSANGILKMEAEMDQFLGSPSIDFKADVNEYWRTHQREFPSLAKLARKFLALPSSSVYSERTFSELGNICGGLRSSLTPDKSEMLLFLHHNISRVNMQ